MTNQGEMARFGKPMSRVILDRAVRVFAGIVVVAAGLATLAPMAFAQGASQIVLSCTTAAPESSSSNGCSSSELSQPSHHQWEHSLLRGRILGLVPKSERRHALWPGLQRLNVCRRSEPSTNKATYEATSVSGGSSADGNTGLEVTFTSSDGDVTCTIDVANRTYVGRH